MKRVVLCLLMFFLILLTNSSCYGIKNTATVIEETNDKLTRQQGDLDSYKALTSHMVDRILILERKVNEFKQLTLPLPSALDRIETLERQLLIGIPFQSVSGIYPKQKYEIEIMVVDSESDDGKSRSGRVIGRFDDINRAIKFLENISQ